MVETEPQTAELAGELQRVLSKLFSVLRRGDTRGAGNTGAGDLTLAQLSILLTLLESGPIRMTELAAHERVRTPTTQSSWSTGLSTLLATRTAARDNGSSAPHG